MNAQTLNQILTGANSALNPQFLWGYQPVGEITADEQYLNRAALDIVEVERAATLLLGELMGLKIDEEIFRGSIPQNQDEGFEVKVESDSPGVDIRYRTYDINCTGRHSDRNLLIDAFSKLCGKLPIPTHVTVNYQYMAHPVTFALIQQTQKAHYGSTLFNGKVLMAGTLDLQIFLAV